MVYLWLLRSRPDQIRSILLPLNKYSRNHKKNQRRKCWESEIYSSKQGWQIFLYPIRLTII